MQISRDIAGSSKSCTRQQLIPEVSAQMHDTQDSSGSCNARPACKQHTTTCGLMCNLEQTCNKRVMARKDAHLLYVHLSNISASKLHTSQPPVISARVYVS